MSTASWMGARAEKRGERPRKCLASVKHLSKLWNVTGAAELREVSYLAAATGFRAGRLMKTRVEPLMSAAWCGLLSLSAVANLQATSLGHPARFGVIDITPYELNAEAYQNSEPSLAVRLIR